MCSVFLFINQIKNIPLAIISNRDAFQTRESAEIQGWDKDFKQLGNHIFAPRDEKRKGTWFAFKNENDNYKWAILTNIRNPNAYTPNLKSRGAVIPLFLNFSGSSVLFLDELKKMSPLFNGFNLLFGDRENIYHFHSADSSSEKVFSFTENSNIKKIITLSNATLNSKWPKTVNTQKIFLKYFKHHSDKDKKSYWNYLKKEMQNKKKYPLSQLPQTGVPEEQEIYVSSLFIDGEVYGTRSTLFFGIEKNAEVFFYEQTYNKYAQATLDKKIFLRQH